MAAPQRKAHTREDINRAVQTALRQSTIWLDQQFTAEISAVKWAFPTPPQVRDIVDTGRLRASQTREERVDGVSFTWPVPYAMQVHEGGVTFNGLAFPGRPWTQEPLRKYPTVFGNFFAQALQGAAR